MTTQFNKRRPGGGAVPATEVDASLDAEGIGDLAIRALAELAAGPMEAELSADAMAALPDPCVSVLARAMADPDSDEAEAMVSEMLGAGLSIRELCLSYLGPAAQELGRLWECDALPFTEVSMATARMQAILRNLPGTSLHGLRGRAPGALFAATPGETHTLGVLIAADHFRRLGWDVGVLVGQDHDGLCRRILADDRPLLGLSCAGGHSLKALARLIEVIQARRPDLAIVISGAVTQDPEALAVLPECDGIIDALETAEEDLAAALADARTRCGLTEALGAR